MYAFVLKQYRCLRFSPAVAAAVRQAGIIPSGSSARHTRADAGDRDWDKIAAGFEVAAGTVESAEKGRSREKREEEKERKFLLKQKKKKEKHRGR